MTAGEPLKTQQAWVVFSGQTDMAWLKVLKRGFRHCFVLLNDGQRWVTLDPMLHHMDVEVHHNIPPEYDLPAWLGLQGYRIVKAPLLRRQNRPAPVMFFTCVEAVKRILGLHNRLILTPWQLYRYLNNQIKGDLLWDH